MAEENKIDTQATAEPSPAAAPVEPAPAQPSDEQKAKDLYDFEEPTESNPADSDDKGGEEIPAKPAEEPAKPGTEQPTFGDDLLAKAEKLGIPKDDVQAFGTPEAAECALNLLEKRLGTAAAPGNKSGTPDAAGQPPSPDAEFKPFEVKLDPEQYDPEILKAITGMNEHYAGQTKQLQGQLQQALGALQAQQTAEFVNNFDGEVNKLGDSYADVVGKGPINSLDPKSELHANRMKIVDEMNVIASGYKATGKPMPPFADVFSKAVSSVFKDKQKSIARKELSASLKGRQFLNRPGAQNHRDVTPEQGARNYVRKFLDAHNESEPATAGSAAEF